VRDIAINARQGEVAIATHGRSFWILDNLALLEQLARDPSPSAAGVRLFAPETAWLSHAYGGGDDGTDGENPRYGASVFFNLPKNYDGRTPLSLTFEDAQGTVVRTFVLHPKNKKAKELSDEQRAGLDAAHLDELALDELTTVAPGSNLFVWDLRYPPAAEVPGRWLQTTDDFNNSVRGPTVVPGSYTAVLRYGGQTLKQPVVVALDPRLHPTPGDLAARLALERQVHATLDSLNRAINAAIAARPRLSQEKRAQLDAAIADLVQRDIHSSEGDVAKETKLNDHLAFLAGDLDLAYERPTAAEYAAYEELKALADAGVAKLQAIVSSA
jgi:hypothetical protein